MRSYFHISYISSSDFLLWYISTRLESFALFYAYLSRLLNWYLDLFSVHYFLELDIYLNITWNNDHIFHLQAVELLDWASTLDWNLSQEADSHFCKGCWWKVEKVLIDDIWAKIKFVSKGTFAHIDQWNI